MNRARFAVALVAAALGQVTRAAGPKPIDYDLKVDVPITVVAIGAWVGTELAKERLAPEECRFCDPNRLDVAVRNAVVWRDPIAARRASDALVFGVLPAAMIAHQVIAANGAGDLEAGFVDVLVVAEATALAADINQLVKFIAARERPFVHFGDPERRHEPDDHLSFYSGHTSLAFSLAASAGMVSTLRGYRSAPWVWGVGMSLAAGTGWLRMGGDMHCFTDVLVGAAVGTSLGAGLTWALHRGRGGATSAEPAGASPAMLALSFAF